MRLHFVIMVLALAGCASQPPVERAPPVTERVILLSSDADRPSAVVVRSGDSEVVLDTPYTTVDMRGGALAINELSSEGVQRRYGGLLSAQPPQPEAFMIYFQLGSDELTAASKMAFDHARRRISAWPAVEVVVTGHTDRLGSSEYNDALSRQRAQSIANRLVRSGVPSNAIEIAARGEREPLVQTPDGVPEPRNRRVEIKVR